MDQDNITGEKGSRIYETLALKGKRCVFCHCSFCHHLHGNKKTYKKNDFTYYVVSPDDYLHECCFEPLVTKHYKKNVLKFNGRRIDSITQYDRFGKQLYTKNYVKGIKSFLRKKYKKEAEKKFIDKVQHLYAQHDLFSFHCTNYEFKEEKMKEFERLLRRVNRKYRKKGVTITLTPKEVGYRLST